MAASYANPFSNPRFITTCTDLQSILSRCFKCYKLTLNGTLVVPLHVLSHLMLPKKKQNKFCLIIHVPHFGLGHWILISVYFDQGQAFIIDPANQFHKCLSSVNIIRTFCKNNTLSGFDFAAKFEASSSYSCGQLCLAIVAKTSLFSFNQMLELRKLIRSYSVEFNEYHLMLFMQRHFNVYL